MIGLNGSMSVVETDGLATVCAVIMGSAEDCPANFPFRLLLTTGDITDDDRASKVYELNNCRCSCNLAPSNL